MTARRTKKKSAHTDAALKAWNTIRNKSLEPIARAVETRVAKRIIRVKASTAALWAQKSDSWREKRLTLLVRLGGQIVAAKAAQASKELWQRA